MGSGHLGSPTARGGSAATPAGFQSIADAGRGVTEGGDRGRWLQHRTDVHLSLHVYTRPPLPGTVTSHRPRALQPWRGRLSSEACRLIFSSISEPSTLSHVQSQMISIRPRNSEEQFGLPLQPTPQGILVVLSKSLSFP